VLQDDGSLTDYTLFAYTSQVEHHDGVKRNQIDAPALVRFSGAGAFEVSWESLVKLRPPVSPPDATKPAPAAREEADQEARRAVAREVVRQHQERVSWVKEAWSQLDEMEYRLLDEWDDLPAEDRRARVHNFERDKQGPARRALPDGDGHLSGTQARRLGKGPRRGRADALGYDPNSEKVAVRTVLAELERLGYDVDDRQTAGVGYDLLTRNVTTGDQRLVEVKGQRGRSSPSGWSPTSGRRPGSAGRTTGCTSSPSAPQRRSSPRGCRTPQGRSADLARSSVPDQH
jgi:hypothetical protein